MAFTLPIFPIFASPFVPEAQATDWATPGHAERIVRGAIARIKKVGKEKAFAAFNDPQGPFIYRDLYVAVYDLTGRCLAHGADKSRIGKQWIDEKDEDEYSLLGNAWPKPKLTARVGKNTNS